MKRKGGVILNEKSKVTMLELETGQLKEFTGHWSIKEVYQLCKNYEKSKKWKVKFVEFGI